MRRDVWMQVHAAPALSHDEIWAKSSQQKEHAMDIRKTVTLVEEINSEYGASANPPLRRVAIAAVFENPLAGKAAGADLKPLIEYSLELGASLTKTALATLGASPSQLRGGGRHRRRPRTWRCDDTSETRHGD